jgi:cytochrome bd-type quinol oxidase subunit 2
VVLLLLFPKTGFTPALVITLLCSSWLLSPKQQITKEFKRNLTKVEITLGLLLAVVFVVIAVSFETGKLDSLVSSSLIRWVAAAVSVYVVFSYYHLIQLNRHANKT